jgi:hypothetical protein
MNQEILPNETPNSKKLNLKLNFKEINLKSYSKLLVLIILLGSTSLLYLFLAGWRPSFIFEQGQQPVVSVTQTGMISAKSDPQGASVYLDGKLLTATNNTLSGIEPGKHNLKIIKNGYAEWQKEIEVFPELVTDITAVLISETPRIEPLTNTGARFPVLSHTLEKIAFFSKDPESPGIWVINIKDSGLSLFRNSAKNVLKDNNFLTFSEGVSLSWSPDENQLLIELKDNKFYLLDISTNNVTPVSKPNELKDSWVNKLNKKRLDFVSELNLENEIVKIAGAQDTLWSPDNKKFLYKVEENDKIIYKIYNLEKPLPVGEQVETTVFETLKSNKQPQISWYSDSFHLLLTEDYNSETNRGTISMIRIDGTNKVEIYANTLFSDKIFSSPDGSKIIILTRFKSGNQTDLYTLGIK